MALGATYAGRGLRGGGKDKDGGDGDNQGCEDIEERACFHHVCYGDFVGGVGDGVGWCCDGQHEGAAGGDGRGDNQGEGCVVGRSSEGGENGYECCDGGCVGVELSE